MNNRPFLLLIPRKLASGLAALLAVLILSHSAQAANIYWDGTGTSWNSVGSWSTSISTTTDPGSVPVSGDNAIFNTNGVNALQTVNLDANQSVGGGGGLSFNLNSTGGVTLQGGGTDRTLALGTGGIGINAAAGPVTIGSATAGQSVVLNLGGDQNWANNGSSLLTINNGVTNSVASKISLTGSGSGGATFNGIISNGSGTTSLTVNNGSASTVTTLTGANTYTGATTITKGTVVVSGANGALGNTATTISYGSMLTLDDRGVGAANANRMGTSAVTLNNGTTFKYLGSDQAATNSTESIGVITLGGGTGLATITVTYGGSNAATVTSGAATGGFTRAASSGGLALINGTNLGANTVAGGSVGQFLSATAPTTVGTTAGGTTGIDAGAKDTRIALFRLGESGTGTGQKGTATGIANTFLTYNATTGYRPLNPTDEFTNNAITATHNTYLTTGTTSTSGTAAINSLVVNGGNLSITGGDTLTNTSGMLLFASNGAISGAGTFTLGGASNQEGIIALGAGVDAVIGSNMTTGTTGLTVYGQGSLKLTGANTFGTTTAIQAGATLIVGSNSALGTSRVLATGGTLRGDGQARSISGTLVGTTTGMTIGGSSDLTFTGTSSPAYANTQYANTALLINNTGSTTFSGVFSLNNVASGSNNGAGILAFGSSANVVISGPIQDNNTGNVATPDTGLGNLVFRGVGANLTISGNNGYGALKNTQITPSAGYNTVTVGGPGGANATITPFGATRLYTNTNTTLFLIAETDGQILGNGFSGGGSGMGFGFAGTNSMTLGGTWVASAASSLTNLSTGTLTFGNTISGNSLSLLGSGNTTLNSNATMAAGAFTLTATQTGTVTLSNTNNWTGNTTLSGGTVVLDYSAANANRLTQRNSVAADAAALGLGGVNLQLSGGAFAQTLGTPTSGANGTTLNSGQSKISQTNTGTSTIALGAITRNAGGVINFQTGVASTTTASASGILGGYATVGGTDWATGGGTISALGSYDSFGTPGSNKNILQDNSASVAATTTVNSLKITTSADSQSLAITSGQTLGLTSGGVLFTGNHDYSIAGGTLKQSAGLGEVIVQQNGSGVLTIDSIVGNKSGGFIKDIFTKAGSGTLVLTADNTSSVTDTRVNYLLGGILRISANNNLVGAATSTINFNGGTLQTTADFTTARTITLDTNGGTFLVNTGTTLTSNGVISGTSYKGLTKTGLGTLELQATNTFLAPVTVTQGTLKLSNAAALGASSTGSNRSVAPVLVNGGTLDINGQTTALGNLTLTSGTISDTAGTGTLAAYSFNLQSGTVGAALADVILTGNTSGNSINVYKTTAGTVTVTGANTYSGSTIVSAGALLVNNSSGSGTGTGQVTVNGGTLGGTGTISGGVTINTGGTLAPGNSPGLLTVGSLVLNTGSTTVMQLEAITTRGTTYDAVNSNGALTYGGSLTISLNPGTATIGDYNLFDFTSQSGTFTGGITFLGGSDGTFDYNTGVLSLTVVPEPSTWALLAFSLMTVMIFRRRRA